jgi:heme A synthase
VAIGSENAVAIFLLTLAAFLVSLVAYQRRSRHPGARVALIVSAVALGAEVMFGLVFLFVLVNMPNMAEF